MRLKFYEYDVIFTILIINIRLCAILNLMFIELNVIVIANFHIILIQWKYLNIIKHIFSVETKFLFL